jgi:hypothetical protein
MVARFLSGHKPVYKPIDYEKIELLTQIRNSSANRGLHRVNKLQKEVVRSREEQLFQEHRRLWEVELRRLKEAEEKVARELYHLKPSSPNLEGKTTAKEEIYEEIDDLKDIMQYNFREFVKNTVDPILMLREDLLSWMKENRHKLSVGHHDEEKEIEITETVLSVKEQQTSIMTNLDLDRCSLEQELAAEFNDLQRIHSKVQADGHLDSVRSGMTSTSSSYYSNLGNLQMIKTGVPGHLYTLYCPDQDLADACFDEFDILDERYVMELETLEEKYEDVIKR